MARLEFSIATQRDMLKRSGGICECHRIPHVFEIFCGTQLGTGNTFFEHIIQDFMRPDNSIENGAALTRTCWRFKTDTFDLPNIAKTKRVFDFNNGIEDPWKKPLPGGRKSEIKMRMIGGRSVPCDRRTGEPLSNFISTTGR